MMLGYARSLAPSWRMVAIILLAASLPAGAARAEFPLEPAYPTVSMKGPPGAKGAVVWNHGINFLYGREASATPVPILMTAFRDAGWDVFRLLRPRMSEEP